MTNLVSQAESRNAASMLFQTGIYVCSIKQADYSVSLKYSNCQQYVKGKRKASYKYQSTSGREVMQNQKL